FRAGGPKRALAGRAGHERKNALADLRIGEIPRDPGLKRGANAGLLLRRRFLERSANRGDVVHGALRESARLSRLPLDLVRDGAVPQEADVEQAVIVLPVK